MDQLTEFSTRIFFGNELKTWAFALAVFVLWLTVLPLTRATLERRLNRPHPGQSAAALEVVLALVHATTRIFLVMAAVWLALRLLWIPPAARRAVQVAFLLILWFQVALWATAAIRHMIATRRGLHLVEPEGAASLNILRFVGIAAVWIVAFLMLLANLGIEIMPLVAGLGIGGIAIALAVQNVLGDLLASLSIALDKPFRVGDFLVVGEEKGTVEYIGIKSTRLRSLTGEVIVLSNGDVLKSRVRNYKPLMERRIAFSIGITYETPRELVGKVAGMIEGAIRAQPKTRVDRVHFASFGDFALVYEAVYFVLDPEYNTYMNIQQAINLQLLGDFARHGIEFAYPTTRQFTVAVPTAEAAE
ncbi:MAG: mechanosensitive ion channel family protein [Steroidobacteraceae bacterium]